MDECVHFWRIFREIKNQIEVLLVVSLVRSDILSHTLCGVVAFEIDILMQALFEEESQCSFTSLLGRCAFTTRYSCIFSFNLIQIVMHVVCIKV